MGTIFTALLLVMVVLFGIVLFLAGSKRWIMAQDIFSVWAVQEAVMDHWFDQAGEINRDIGEFDEESSQSKQWELEQLENILDKVRELVGERSRIEYSALKDDLSRRELRTYKKMASGLPESLRRTGLKRMMEEQG